mmetsp:Transcript_41805/g.100338  ORF Transcript_41805/g.100338 Transcript_41805/m.100338 type:complete len:449 (-) Transcript_41805:145-1491(-)
MAAVVQQQQHQSSRLAAAGGGGETTTASVSVPPDDDDFDPFGVGEIATSPSTAKGGGSGAKKSDPGLAVPELSEVAAASTTTTASLLPPKVLVKFKVHEEISSVARISNNNYDDESTLNTNSVSGVTTSGNHTTTTTAAMAMAEGASDVYVNGTLYGQVVSSDATKNSPFILTSSSTSGQKVDFVMNSSNDHQQKSSQQQQQQQQKQQHYVRPLNPERNQKHEEDLKLEQINATVVDIPKDVLNFVKLGTYSIKESVDHMPLLLEQKVIRSKNKIQVAVQVRSKLSNPDDLSSFSIAVSIPGRVNGNTVTILSGDGSFDKWRRVITWEVDRLPKGQSFMVSAKCMLQDENDPKIQKIKGSMNDFLQQKKKSDDDQDGNNNNNNDDNNATNKMTVSSSNVGLKFPVLLRCRANDKVSTAKFHAIEANGHPANVSSTLVNQSFSMIHRLQ